MSIAVMNSIEVFHADSLAGPMAKLKKAFEATTENKSINLISGRSKELAERIAGGSVCDVFAPSDPSVVSATGATWSIIFSANEMVLVTKKGNPLQLRQMSSVAKPGIKLARVVGEKDMATHRTITFIKNATAAEGASTLAESIIAATAVLAPTIPDVAAALKTGEADAGILYYSAAVAAADAVDIIRFPATVNLSADIRNVLTVPSTVSDRVTAFQFIRFILSGEGQAILRASGQPPIVPPIFDGEVPKELVL